MSPQTFLTEVLPHIVTIVGLCYFSSSFFLAKHSLPQTSSCEDRSASDLLERALNLSQFETRTLIEHGIISSISESDNVSSISSGNSSLRYGCWMERRMEAVAIVVVDALRFDFAKDRLPLSIGSRLLAESKKTSSPEKKIGHSQLFKFVADPPTVTMQRLKGLTTGGLPTFADISGSFGGADVDEDSWVRQLKDVPYMKRIYKRNKKDHKDHLIGIEAHRQDIITGSTHPYKIAFVGDDTWIDLFPKEFDESHPFPSFNTRDLDTVDDGCLLYLPRYLRSLGSIFEVIVVHFLGVDHVGHTYGPNDEHMEKKLSQMDKALSRIFGKINEAVDECRAVFVFGDHGMTEDGNHGGGTIEETNAALFAQYSPGCGENGFTTVTGHEAGFSSQEAFQTIHQIDLVPTLSLLLGLPIPFANLGGLVPALLPPIQNSYAKKNSGWQAMMESPLTATALALNAAQVWNYLTSYSSKSNSLPLNEMDELKNKLDDALKPYQSALSALKPTSIFQGENMTYNNDNNIQINDLEFREAAGLFKFFLLEATEMGKRVWTRFDTKGMVLGIAIIFFAVLFMGMQKVSHTIKICKNFSKISLELKFSFFFVIFQCVLLTFSNSYIEREQDVVRLALATICILAASNHFIQMLHGFLMNIRNRSVARLDFDKDSMKSLLIIPVLLISIPLCGRFNEIFISGHGLDPSLHAHNAHHPLFFCVSAAVLGYLRYALFQQVFFMHQLKNRSLERALMVQRVTNLFLDLSTLLCLVLSWNEKYHSDSLRTGFKSARVALLLLSVGIASTTISPIVRFFTYGLLKKSNADPCIEVELLFKILLLIVAVTGPSCAPSAVIFVVQAIVFHKLFSFEIKVHDFVLATLWRLIVRHTFFVTGHACSFNRLQFSAAFVVTSTFHFVLAGLSLFLNTFGWDILGSILICKISISSGRTKVWQWFSFFQIIETFCNCVSVSLLKRHLMVWAIFAPRFVFGSIFCIIVSSVTSIVKLSYDP